MASNYYVAPGIVEFKLTPDTTEADLALTKALFGVSDKNKLGDTNCYYTCVDYFGSNMSNDDVLEAIEAYVGVSRIDNPIAFADAVMQKAKTDSEDFEDAFNFLCESDGCDIVTPEEIYPIAQGLVPGIVERIASEGAYWCDRNRLGEFGGDTQLVSARVNLYACSSDYNHLFDSIDKALIENNPSECASLLFGNNQNILNGIKDRAQLEEVAYRCDFTPVLDDHKRDLEAVNFVTGVHQKAIAIIGEQFPDLKVEVANRTAANIARGVCEIIRGNESVPDYFLIPNVAYVENRPGNITGGLNLAMDLLFNDIND